MKQLNIAQRLMIALGYDRDRLLMYGGRRPSFTKKGPGRYRPKSK